MPNIRPTAEVIDGKLFVGGEEVEVGDLDPIRVLGQGANGIVIVARDQHLNREVAVKVWTRQNRNAGQGAAEAEKLARFRHPLIAEVWAFHPAPTRPWAVLELVEGQTVDEWLDESPPLGTV